MNLLSLQYIEELEVILKNLTHLYSVFATNTNWVVGTKLDKTISDLKT